MKAYLPHFWTVLLVVFLPIAGITLMGDQATTSFSGKHVEKGWPLIYSKQDFVNTAAIGKRIGEPPQAEGYIPKGEAEIDQSAFWIDVGVDALLVLPPVALCEWFLRRRGRHHSKEQHDG